jgi:hypothetical protein
MVASTAQIIDSSALPAPTTHLPLTSAQYAEAVAPFDWSYAIDAVPRPSRSKWCTTKRKGYSDEGIKHLFAGVIRDLANEQRNRITYACSLETGGTGWRHLHAVLGNISRLTPDDTAAVFRANGFGDTNVKVWDSAKHSGYYFKSLDPTNSGYGTAEWDFDLTWNRTCKQQMKLNRRHLDRLLQSTVVSKSSDAVAADRLLLTAMTNAHAHPASDW